MVAIAFSAPILPGKTERFKNFSHEVEQHHSEYEASRRRVGITREMAWLQSTPMGDVGVIYFEADEPQRVFQALGSSQEAFDVWFREYTLDVHGLDLTQPLPGPVSIQTFASTMR